MNELRRARVTVSMGSLLHVRGKGKAHELEISFSGYLERLIERDLSGGGDSQMDRIESKLDMIKTAFDRSLDVELDDLPVRYYGIPKPLVVKRGTVIDDDCQMPLEDFLKSPYSVGCTGSSYGSAKDT